LADAINRTLDAIGRNMGLAGTERSRACFDCDDRVDQIGGFVIGCPKRVVS
jgi:hypothetical protein